MTGTMGCCQTVIAPCCIAPCCIAPCCIASQGKAQAATNAGKPQGGIDVGSLHRQQCNLDNITPKAFHLHRDSLADVTMVERGVMGRCAVSGQDRRRSDILSIHSMPSPAEFPEFLDSKESIFTSSSLGDESTNNTVNNDDLIHDTGDNSGLNNHLAHLSKTKAVLEEFELCDRMSDFKASKGIPLPSTRNTKCNDNKHGERLTRSLTVSRSGGSTNACHPSTGSMSDIQRWRSSFWYEQCHARTTPTRRSHRSKTRHCDSGSDSAQRGGCSGDSSSQRGGGVHAYQGALGSLGGERRETKPGLCSAKGRGSSNSEQGLQDLVNVVCKEGRTLLHNAAQQGDIKMVKRLLQNGMKVNARDTMRQTPLHEVANMGHVSVGRLLLQHGAKVNAHDKWKCTPLHQAIAWKQAKMVQLLLQYNAQATGGTLLQDVINLDTQDDIIVKLIARGADVNATDMTGQTPLHIAVKHGRTNLMWLLLEAGANLNKVSRGMMEGNHGAVLRNARRQLDPLGLDRMLQDGWSPLRMAQKYKHFDLVVWLLKCGANIVVCDSMGRFPHHKATTQRNCPSLHHIVAEPTCPIDIHDIGGNTAIKLNFEAHAKCMVDLNSQCTCCSNQPGTTPVPSCDEYANTTLLLLQHGADITDLYIHGYEILHHLCSSKFSYDVRLLRGVLNSGNDLSSVLSSAQSCLNSLKRQERLDMYEYLEYFVHSPRTLQDQCRLVIRRRLRTLRRGRSIWTGITSLPLPHALMDFLLLQALQRATLTRHFSVGLPPAPRLPHREHTLRDIANDRPFTHNFFY